MEQKSIFYLFSPVTRRRVENRASAFEIIIFKHWSVCEREKASRIYFQTRAIVFFLSLKKYKHLQFSKYLQEDTI